MELDVEQLQKDLKELQQKKEQAAERLRTLAPRGRGDRFGRGRGAPYGGRLGPGPGRGISGPGQRGIGRRPGIDEYPNSYRDHDWEGGPRRMRGGGFPGRGAFGHGASFNPRDTYDRDQAPAPKKRTLSSAVVVDGEQRIPSTQDDPPEPPSLKRPAPSELDENPAMRKRNRRMFGNLLGTLQRFKEEEKKFQQTPTAQKQAEALKRAEEKAAAEGQRLRQRDREKKVAERQLELDKIRQFNLQSDLKALEIIYAKKILNHQRCLTYLLTKAAPALYWEPKKHTPETSAALLERQDEFERWKVEQQEQLDKEKETLTEQAAARKAAAMARATQLQQNGGGKGAPTAEDEAVDKEEAELEQQLQEQEQDGEGAKTGDATTQEKANGLAEIEATDMETNVADEENGERDEAAKDVSGSPKAEAEAEAEAEEDGELPDAAEEDNFRADDAEAAGADLLDKLDSGNPDAENIEDLLE